MKKNNIQKTKNCYKQCKKCSISMFNVQCSISILSIFFYFFIDFFCVKSNIPIYNITNFLTLPIFFYSSAKCLQWLLLLLNAAIQFGQNEIP